MCCLLRNHLKSPAGCRKTPNKLLLERKTTIAERDDSMSLKGRTAIQEQDLVRLRHAVGIVCMMIFLLARKMIKMIPNAHHVGFKTMFPSLIYALSVVVGCYTSLRHLNIYSSRSISNLTTRQIVESKPFSKHPILSPSLLPPLHAPAQTTSSTPEHINAQAGEDAPFGSALDLSCTDFSKMTSVFRAGLLACLSYNSCLFSNCPHAGRQGDVSIPGCMQ